MAVKTVQSNQFVSRGRLYPNINLFTSTDYVSVGRRNVNISITTERPASHQGEIRTYVNVMLQKQVNGMWHYVDTKTGYTAYGSSMERVFTNVSSAYKLRVRFELTASHAYPTKYYYLPIWQN